MWKTYQKQKKVNTQVKTALLALGLLVFILILGNIVSFFFSLNKSFSRELGNEKQYSWDGRTSINIVLTSIKNNDILQVSVLGLNPNEKKVAILHISESIYFELPKSLGSWPLGSVYKLGQEEKPAKGISLLKLSLSKLIGLPIDGIIIADLDKSYAKSEDMILAIHKNPLNIINVITHIRSDLTLIETGKMLWSLSQIRPDKLTSLDFARSNITESKLLPDSSRVLGVDNIKLDLFIREKMADATILDEGEQVAVFNGTDNQGIAQEAARIITNMGGIVVMVSNTTSPHAKSVVVNNAQGKKTTTYKRLAQVFAPECLKFCQSNDTQVKDSRAQVNVVLGQDYFDKWNKR